MVGHDGIPRQWEPTPGSDEFDAQSIAPHAEYPDPSAVEIVRQALVAQNQQLALVERDRTIAQLKRLLAERDRQLAHERAQHAADIAAREQRHAEELLKAKRLDEMTGLPNKFGIYEELDTQLAREGATVTLLVVDFDEFKLINDSHGHLSGDLMVQEFATHFSAAFRRGDDHVASGYKDEGAGDKGEKVREYDGSDSMLGRFAGDEFCVVVSTYDDPAAVLRYVNRKLQEFSVKMAKQRPGQWKGASVGVAMSTPGAPLTRPELFQAADYAMYSQKSTRSRLARTALGVPAQRSSSDGLVVNVSTDQDGRTTAQP
jgi:GGDEF domain-containing protein